MVRTGMSHAWLPVSESGVVGRRCQRCRSVVANSPPGTMSPRFARLGYTVVFIPPNLDGSGVTNMQADVHVPVCRTRSR